tara:strand:+ start:1099 stop:1815 length:717 start_codon:yes stop_codon:yes gene_type:complete
MEPNTPSSSSRSRTVPTVQVTAPADYFTYTPGNDLTQPMSPILLEQASTPAQTPTREAGAHKEGSSRAVPSLLPLPQPPTTSPESDIKTLGSALSVVRNHLSSLDASIKRNISAQSLNQTRNSVLRKSETPSDTSQVMMTGNASKPHFKVKDTRVFGALLDTVKVCCVLERSLEALIEVLEMAEPGAKAESSGGESTPELALMSVCTERGVDVEKVMGSALEGVKSVVAFIGKKGRSD